MMMQRLHLIPSAAAPTISRGRATKTTAFKIDRGIPMPVLPARNLYPFAQMQIGDSFLVPMEAATRCRANFKHHRPMRFTAHTVVENGTQGLRVWRLE